MLVVAGLFGRFGNERVVGIQRTGDFGVRRRLLALPGRLRFGDVVLRRRICCRFSALSCGCAYCG